jgi:hypothetical protein
MENNNILKTERRIIKRLPNPNKYPTKNRERHTRKLGRYIANYGLLENANIKNRVTRFNALRRQIANLPPYEATENAGTLNEGVEEALAGLRLSEAPLLPSAANNFEARLAAEPSMSAPAETSTAAELPVEASTELETSTPLEISAPVEAPAPAEASVDCAELFDPCTREPIENGDINILDKRVREIKKLRSKELHDATAFPALPSRWDLLLFIMNRTEKPDEGLLQYNINGQLYEAYWDIVFSLGLADDFPITKEFYMFNGKIETLVNIDSFTSSPYNPYTYLSSKNINEGSKSGASDVTFVYKKNKHGLSVDPCSSDPSIIVRDNCSRDTVSSTTSTDEKPLFYFCSSKYFKRDETKGVDKFDIQNIYTAAKNLQQDYDRKIVLLVRDRGAVEEKLRKAMRKYISEEASYVFGMTDLFAHLTVLYDRVHTAHKSAEPITSDELKYILKIESPPKPILKLRLHQYIATYKICDAINRFKTAGGNNKFLVGIVPRGGKTFIAGGIIDKLNPRRVVVLLGAKSETLSQFKKDLFEEFQNFQDYECVDVVNSTNVPIDPAKKYIFVMSVELYKQPESARLLLQELKGGALRADLFICDEAHLKQTTARAVRAQEQGTVRAVVPQEEEADATDQQEEDGLKELDKQIERDVPVVYMTGTYIKPLTAFKIPDNNVVIWDYQDIQQAKELSTNEEYFRENFGELYNRALQTCTSYGQTYETIEGQYRKFPELYLLTTQFTPDAKEAFLKQSTGGVPTLSHLFKVRRDFDPQITAPELWYTGFSNPKGILRLLNYLAPPSQQINTVDGEPVEPISSVLKSIDIIAQRIGDRLGFFTSEFVTHSQLWFLPHMMGHPLYKRMCALAGAIFQSKWFRKYFHVLAVSSSVKWAIPGAERNSILIKASDGTDSCGVFSWGCPTGNKSLKQCLIDEEAYARSKGKGLIILAQNMLHLGISLPCVDIVVLLDVGEKVDERIQKMYRALTESTNKKGGYIVDMNYFRTVTAIMNYQITAEKSRKGKKEIYASDVTNTFNKVLDIFSIDIDKPIYGTHEERMSNNSDIQKTTIPELEKIFAGSKSSGNSLVLQDAAFALNENVKGIFEREYKSSYNEFLRSLKEEEKKQQRILREEGSNVISAEHVTENADEDNGEPDHVPIIFKKEDVTEQQKKNAYIEIFKTTLKLGAFGTNSGDIDTLKLRLRSDNDLRETLYDTLIKRGAISNESDKDYIIDNIVIPGLNKMITDNKGASYHAMKESINDEGKYPAQIQSVFDYIKKHLAPKDAERHKYGEVFTPLTLVDEMLSTLPDEVWTNPDLKWLDPANGIGNFPIKAFVGQQSGPHTYPGLMKGLERAIPNESKRCKHIVENMLYMVDINGKNNVIARRLFEKLCPNAKPNIEKIDSKEGFLTSKPLVFNSKTINKFDIIMGNPPFNRGAVRVAMVTNKTRNERSSLGLEDTDSESGFWFKFVEKALAKGLLNPNGYLLFIHPITWFKPDRAGAHNLILSKQLHNLKIYKNDGSAKDLFEGFGKISIAYYLLENKPVSKQTRIEYGDYPNKHENVLLSTKSILILNYNSIYNKIITKSQLFDNTSGLKHNTLRECNDTGMHKLITLLGGKGETKGTIYYVLSSKPHQDQTMPKLIVGGSDRPIILFDKDGEYGLYKKGQRHYFVGNNLNKINDYFKTKLSTLILKNVKWEQDFIKPGYFPDVRTLPLDIINDDTLANFFEFSEDERRDIAQMPDPIHPRDDRIIKLTCKQLSGVREEEPAIGGSRYNAKTRKLRRH